MSVAKFICRLLRFKSILKVLDFEFKDHDRKLYVVVRPHKNGCRCPICRRRCKIINRLDKPREWRDLTILGIEVCLIYVPCEIDCPTHGRQQEEIPWAEAMARVTYRVEHGVTHLAQEMTQKEAAKLLRIPASTFSDILHRVVQRAREGHHIRGLHTLGVDEIAYCRGHKYATIIYDLGRSKVLWVGRGKGAETLEDFLINHLSAYQRKQIRFASCDMSQAYVGTIERLLPHVTLVIDRFHIVKALNAALDEVRKEEWHKAETADKKTVKGLRWLLLRGSKTRTRSDMVIIQALKRGNNRIYRAWVLKDEFEMFWEYHYTGSAAKFLKNWMTRALKSRIEPIRKFVATVKRHERYIMPYIETRLTNAKGEGINRLLQMVKQRACGFENLEAFADIIYLVAGDVDIPGSIPRKFQILR
jgi:transposase